MRLLKVMRFGLLCLLGAALWISHGVLRAQGSGDCSTYGFTYFNCSDEYGNECCANSEDVPEYNGDYEGTGKQTIDYENVNCTPIDGDKGCCSSFSDYLVVNNPDCCDGDQCSTDLDCPCPGYICFEEWGECEPND